MTEMSPPPAPNGRANRFAPTSGWRVALPALATALAVFLLLLSFVGFSFHQRLDGYVLVEGTVQHALSGAEVGLDLTAAEVRYRIGGNDHVGILALDRGNGLSEGDSIRVMAPSDGSPFAFLRLPASGATQALGWICFLVGLGASLAGAVWLVRAIVARNRTLREQTWSGFVGPLPAVAAGPGPAWVDPGPRDSGVPLGSFGPGLSAPREYDESTQDEPTQAEPTQAEPSATPGADSVAEAPTDPGAASADQLSDQRPDQRGEGPDQPPTHRGP